MKTAFYSALAISAAIAALSFLFSQYVAYKNFKFEQNKAVYECMKEYYPAVTPNDKGFYVASTWNSCREIFER